MGEHFGHLDLGLLASRALGIQEASLSTLRTASKISLLTMVSRALGFLRDILMLRMLIMVE